MESAEPAVSCRPPDAEARLLDAAEEVFARLGYRGTAVAGIASEAGLSKTLVHYYFRSKEGIYRAMAERLMQRIGEAFLDDLSADDPVVALSTATRRYVQLLADNPRYARLIGFAALEGTRGYWDNDAHQRLREAAVAAVIRGSREGVFRLEDPRHVMATLEGVCLSFFEHEEIFEKLWGDEYERERVVGERADHVVRMLLAGLGFAGAPPGSHPEGIR